MNEKDFRMLMNKEHSIMLKLFSLVVFISSMIVLSIRLDTLTLIGVLLFGYYIILFVRLWLIPEMIENKYLCKLKEKKKNV